MAKAALQVEWSEVLELEHYQGYLGECGGETFEIGVLGHDVTRRDLVHWRRDGQEQAPTHPEELLRYVNTARRRAALMAAVDMFMADRRRGAALFEGAGRVEWSGLSDPPSKP